MADGAVAPNVGGGGGVGGVDGGGAGDQPEQQSWFEMLKGIFWRFLIMYFIMSLFKVGDSS